MAAAEAAGTKRVIRFFSPADVVRTLEDPALLREVIEGGFDVNSTLDGSDGRRGTLLTEACHRRCTASVRVLTDCERTDVNLADEEGYTPLHIAAGRNDDATLTVLISEPNLQLEKRVRQGAGPCWCDDAETARTARAVDLSAAVKPSKCPPRRAPPPPDPLAAEDAIGRTALHIAAQYGCYRALRVLLSHPDTDVTVTASVRKFTPLHYACERDQAACVAALLDDARCDTRALNAPDAEGAPPLVAAVRSAAVLSVHGLCRRKDLDMGVRFGAKGLTAVHVATMAPERAPCLRSLLRRHDARASVESADGCTPLHAALWSNCPEAVTALLTNPRVDVNHTNRIGWTPLTMGLRGLAQARERLLGGGGAWRAWRVGGRVATAGRPDGPQGEQCDVPMTSAGAGGGGGAAAEAEAELPWAGAMLAEAEAEDDEGATVECGLEGGGARSVVSSASSGSGGGGSGRGGSGAVSVGSATRGGGSSGRKAGAPVTPGPGHSAASSTGHSARTGAAAVHAGPMDAAEAAVQDASALQLALQVLIADLRVDLAKREVKPWTPFRKDALEVSRKYRLKDAEGLLRFVLEARSLELLRRGACDPAIAAWFTARGIGAKASAAVMACSIGVRQLSDLRLLADAFDDDPSALADLPMTLLDRTRFARELRLLRADCECRKLALPTVEPPFWAEEEADLSAGLSAAMLRAEQAVSSGDADCGCDGEAEAEADSDAEADAEAEAENKDEDEEAARDGAGAADSAGSARAGAGSAASDGAGAGSGGDTSTGDAAGAGGVAAGAGSDGSFGSPDERAAANGAASAAGDQAAAPAAATDSTGLDLPLRSLLAECGVLAELAGRLLALDPPVRDRAALARLDSGREALLMEGLSADAVSKARAAMAEARQLPRHSSMAAPEELGAFLREKGLDDDLWRPILTRLGARRPSHLGAVRRQHLEGEAIPPLQRDAFFRAVGSLPGGVSGRDGSNGAVATSPSQVLLAEPQGAAEQQPSSLLGFVNFWLLKLYRDRPAIAIALVVVIILAIVGGIVFGSISAADAVSSE